MTTEASPAIAALSNPWPGLAPYTEQQRDLFFGREAEIEELLRLIERETLTILFGRSGSGKSSLLHAGVIPRLRTGLYFPVLLRLNFADAEVDPVAQVKGIAQAAAKSNGLEVDSSLSDTSTATLWEFFHSTDFWGPRNDRLTPLLIFDQFEEAFTIGRDQKQASDFLGQLADLAENRIPQVVGERIRGSAERVNIELGAPNYKIVVSLREDFVSRLDQLRPILPAIMRNRMGLLPLDGARALDVIVSSGKPWVNAAVAQDIVAALAGETGAAPGHNLAQAEIEPAYLSVMCHELFRRMVELGQGSITAELVARERGEILEAMYERSFEGLDPSVRLFVEDRLLTASGFRGTLPLSEAVAEGASLHDLETLVDRRLLRFEDRLGTRHVELSHDLLTGVVKKSRELRVARVAREEEERKREELRRSFRRRAIAASVIAAVAFAILGTLTIWALIEGHSARRATQAVLASNKRLRTEEIQLKNQAQELATERNTALKDEQEAYESNQEMQAARQRTSALSSAFMSKSEVVNSSDYQDALKEVDLYRSTTDQTTKDQLTSSIWDHRNNLQDELASVNAILKNESDNEEAKSLKLSLLFYIANLESQAYGFDKNKYQAFLSYAQSMVKEKDPWLEAKALQALAQSAAIVLLKPDEKAAQGLLDEVRQKSGALQSGKLNAKTWDVLEDAYEVCEKIQNTRDPKDAGMWFALATQAETKAADLDPKYLGDVARIADLYGDFEKEQGDYDASIREYTVAIQYAAKPSLRQKDGKPNPHLVTYLIDRGDAEHAAKHDDQARKDYQDAVADNNQLGSSSDTSYRTLVIAERLGDLEDSAKNYSAALTWYQQEKQIALALAQDDATRRSSVAIAFGRTSSTEEALKDMKAARVELQEQVDTWEKWKSSMQEADLQGYVKALIALGSFDYDQKDYKTALQSFDEASTYSFLTALRWTTSDNEGLIVQSHLLAAQTHEQLNEPDKALASYQDARDMARALVDGDCSPSNLNDLNSVENQGIIHSFVALKRDDEAQAEAQDVMKFVEKSCSSIGKDSSPDLKTALAQFWGNLSWASVRAGGTQTAEACAQMGLALDPTQTWIQVNLAHSYLLSGRIQDAQNLYSTIKTQQWQGHPLSEDIRNDFAELRSLGLGRSEMDGILSSLGPTTN